MVANGGQVCMAKSDPRAITQRVSDGGPGGKTCIIANMPHALHHQVSLTWDVPLLTITYFSVR